MKKYTIITLICLSMALSSVSFAEQDSNEYGIGALENISPRIAGPGEFVFDYNNYNDIRTRERPVSALLVNDGYCLNMLPIKYNDIPQSEKTAAGTIFVTSDAYLQNNYFYNLDDAGVKEWNKVTGYNWITDERDQNYILSNKDNVSITNYRNVTANGFSYYVGVGYDNGLGYGYLHDGIHGGNIVANKPLNKNYMRVDETSSTGYQSQNYEIITYHVNKPLINNGTSVRTILTPGQTIGGEAFFVTPRILGCYAVRPTEGGISFEAQYEYFSHVEFVWLVQHNFKTAYPIINFNANIADVRLQSVFSTNFQNTYYSWTTTIQP